MSTKLLIGRSVATATTSDIVICTSLSTKFLIGKSGAATDTVYNNGCAADHHLNLSLQVLLDKSQNA